VSHWGVSEWHARRCYNSFSVVVKKTLAREISRPYLCLCQADFSRTETGRQTVEPGALVSLAERDRRLWVTECGVRIATRASFSAMAREVRGRTEGGSGMIIETSDNRLYRVRETGNTDLAHVWFGLRVKKTSAGYVPVKNARDELVRKAACRVVAQEAGA